MELQINRINAAPSAIASVRRKSDFLLQWDLLKDSIAASSLSLTLRAKNATTTTITMTTTTTMQHDFKSYKSSRFLMIVPLESAFQAESFRRVVSMRLQIKGCSINPNRGNHRSQAFGSTIMQRALMQWDLKRHCMV
jgi:hypothetical protein